MLIWIWIWILWIHNYVFYIHLYFVFVYIQKFKSNGLLAHESETNQLQMEGDRLVEMKHPGSPTIMVHQSVVLDIRNVTVWELWWIIRGRNQTDQIVIKLTFCQAHRDAVQSDWQAFLNLCLAQETHLDNIEDYRKVESLWTHHAVTDIILW